MCSFLEEQVNKKNKKNGDLGFLDNLNTQFSSSENESIIEYVSDRDKKRKLRIWDEDGYYTSCDEDPNVINEKEFIEEDFKKKMKLTLDFKEVKKKIVKKIEEEEEDEENDFGDDNKFIEKIPIYNKINETKKKESIGYCFGCLFDSSEIKGQENAYSILIKFIENNYGKCDNYSLSRNAHILFKNTIYLPSIKKKKFIPMWRTKTILKHIEEHILEPRIFFGESIRNWKKYFNEIKDSISKVIIDEDSGISKKIPDKDVIKNCIEIQKLINDLYKIDVKKTLFFNENSNLNVNNLTKVNKIF